MDIVATLGSMHGVDKLFITTNGLTLPRKSQKLKKKMELTGVNISLNTLVEAMYAFFTRLQGLSKVKEAILKSIDADIATVQVNCVVTRVKKTNFLTLSN